MTHTAENDAHDPSVYRTAFGWRWGCSCGRQGKGTGTPTAAGAWAAARRHLPKVKRVTPPESGLCHEFIDTGTCGHSDAEHDAMAGVIPPDVTRPTGRTRG